MTITSGRRPSDSIDASRSSAWAPPRCLADDVDVGLAVEEREQPAAHDLVVVDDQDTDGFVPRPAPSQVPSVSAGTQTRTSVPDPGALVIAIRPPISAARLRIESRPK